MEEAGADWPSGIPGILAQGRIGHLAYRANARWAGGGGGRWPKFFFFFFFFFFFQMAAPGGGGGRRRRDNKT